MYIVIFLIDYIYVSLINCPIVFFSIITQYACLCNYKAELKGHETSDRYTK